MALFLDVDGVLLPVAEFGMGGGDLDPDCLACLWRLTDAVPLRIVVTSTWRLRPEKMAQLNAAFEALGIPPAAAATPERATQRTTVAYLEDDPDEQRLVGDRVDEICEWLQENPQPYWLAVDDMDLGVDGRVAGHFLKTDLSYGLVAADVETGLALLRAQQGSAPPSDAAAAASVAPPSPAPAAAPAAPTVLGEEPVPLPAGNPMSCVPAAAPAGPEDRSAPPLPETSTAAATPTSSALSSTVTEYQGPRSTGSAPRKPRFKRVADNPVFAQYRDATPAAPPPAAAPAAQELPAGTASPPASVPPAPAPALAPAPAGGPGDAVQRAAEEWREVERIRPPEALAQQSRLQEVSEANASIPYTAAVQQLREGGAWRQFLPTVKADSSNFLYSLLGWSLKGKLQEERSFVLCLRQTPLNHTDIIHRRMLLSVYRGVTREKHMTVTTGGHMERIGFQGNDPATDLRGAGLFAVVQLLSLVDGAGEVCARLFSTATSLQYEFPFALVGINLTCMALEALTAEKLVRAMNRQGSVLEVLNDFYLGLWHLFETRWTSKPRRITDWDEVRRELQSTARDRPQHVLDQKAKALKSRGPPAAAGLPITGPFAEF